jgi:hypothetical protein
MAKGGGAEVAPTKRGKGVKVMAIADPSRVKPPTQDRCRLHRYIIYPRRPGIMNGRASTPGLRIDLIGSGFIANFHLQAQTARCSSSTPARRAARAYVEFEFARLGPYRRAKIAKLPDLLRPLTRLWSAESGLKGYKPIDGVGALSR